MNKSTLTLLLCMSFLSACSMPSWLGGSKKEDTKLEGTRVAVVAPEAELKADAETATQPLRLPAVNANADWAQHTGNFTAQTSNLALAGDLSVRESAPAGGGESFPFTLVPRPVVGDARIYAMDGNGEITAHAAANIENILWRSKGVSEEDVDPSLGGGLAFDQGVVYAVSGRGVVVALDAATGAEKWHKSLHVPVRSAPRVGAGKLFVVTLDNQTVALNTADGEMQWTQRGITEQAGIMNSVSPTVAGDVVVVPYSSGEIYALGAADGKELWSDALTPGKNTAADALFSGIGGDPLIDGQVVISVSSGGMISVQSLASGQKSWSRPIGSLNTPWLSGDSLFVLSSSNVLISFVKFDGHIRWATQLPRFGNVEEKRDPITMRGPVLADGKLLVTASDGHLYEVAADTGVITRTLDIPERVYTAPVVAGSMVFLIDQGATLHSLK